MPKATGSTTVGAGLDWQNWAGNQRIRAASVARPASTAEVAGLVRAAAEAGSTVKPVGSGHSFTATALTDGVRIDLSRLTGLAAPPQQRRVRVRAGTRLSDLNPALAEHGLAMPNLGDIDAQSISGALATGTHGTGAGYGCLSTFVTGLELVTGTGEVIRCTAEQHPELFQAARVGLGALGVVTEVTLQCADAFILRADERPLPLPDVLAGLDEHVATNDHFEFYWLPYTERTLTKRNNRVEVNDAPLSRFRAWLDDDFLQNTAFGAVCRLARSAPRLTPALLRASAQLLSPRVYTEHSDRVFVTPRRVRFVEMEYGLPRAALPEAFAGLRRVIDGLPFAVAFPVEVRFTAADDIWLSHGYGRDNCYIAIHQYVGMPYEAYFRGFERICTDLGGRPHWGKMHYRDAGSLAPAYPRFDDFLAVRERTDPARVFANAYTRQVLGDRRRMAHDGAPSRGGSRSGAQCDDPA
jgi:L-gulono-1,4-lactone dehydrogenase